MKINILKASALVIIVGIGMSSARGAVRSDDSNEHRLEGTWTVTVSLRDCSLGTPIGSPFMSLLTFARGGTMTETTSSPMFFPALRGPGHGVWSNLRGDSYKASSISGVDSCTSERIKVNSYSCLAISPMMSSQ